MSKKNLLIIVLSFFIGIGVGVYSGTVYEKNTLASEQASQKGGGGQFAGANGQQRGQRGPNSNGGGFINGKVTAKDDKSITVQDKDNSSKIVYFSASTTIGKSVDGSTSDLNIGEQVMVNGQADASGIVTAQNIQIRPEQPVK